MPAEKTKDRLLAATIRLLSQNGSPAELTARRIAAEAQVNLAMINYYFDSKDALMHQAAQSIIDGRAQELKQPAADGSPPREQLRNFLIQLSDITVQYSELTKASVPYVILQGDIEPPHYILPFIRQHFKDARSETECRILAYQLVSFLQLAFVRAADFKKYLGVDVQEKSQRDELLDTLLKLLIPSAGQGG